MNKLAEMFVRNVDLPDWSRILLIKFFSVKFPVGVLVIIRNGRKVLLVRQAYKNEKTWRLPGGFLEAGEDPSEAAKREIKEELGINIKDLSFKRAIYDYPFRGIVIVFESKMSKLAKIKSSREISELNFFHLDYLPKNLLKSHRAFLI